MKRFLLRRHFILLGVCVLLLGVMVPIATFAKGAGSEPHHTFHSSTVTQSVDPSTGVVTAKATTDASCDNPTIIIPSLRKGDKVHIEAEIVPTNGESFASEQSEQEFLKIYDLFGDFVQPIDYLASRVFNFTVTGNNDVLKACILPGVGGDGPDGDELGTIAANLTLAPTNLIKDETGNWGGYVSESTGSGTNPFIYTDVKGSWTVPTANCKKTPDGTSGFWVGIGGIQGDTYLEQIGTNDYCIKGKPSYTGFYEMFPTGPVFFPKAFPFKPGDTVQAEVSFQGNGKFLLTLNNTTQGWLFSTSQTQKAAELNSAEWIAEANTVRLTDFGTIGFSNCSANSRPITGGPVTYRLNINGYLKKEVDILVFKIFRNVKIIRATSGDLTSNDTAFSVKWNHE